MAVLGGTCAAACSVAGASVIAFLGSLGLGALATVLPDLRIPLLVLGAALGIHSLVGFVRRRDILRVTVVASILGAAATAIAWQVLTPNTCQVATGMSRVMARLSPESRRIVREGIYALWPKLGRAPSVDETRRTLGLATDAPILAALGELSTLSDSVIEYPGTHRIRWLWPFSSEDHGVTVVLADAQPVHARCAIDALGMSAMFGKPALITVRTPLDHRRLSFLIDGARVRRADAGVVVSYRPNDCDSMLFFSSRDELARYETLRGGARLTVFPLPEALAEGIQSFGEALHS